MLGKLKGKVDFIGAGFVILDVGGVGYKIHTNAEFLTSLKESSQVSFWIYQAVRENSIDLYGFEKKDELDFFELLLGVSGIGPKSALAILNITSVDNLKSAVRSDDITYLTKVSGVGKKSAKKIVLELRDKLGEAEEKDFAIKGDSDALEALTALGYTTKEAREAIKNIGKEIKDTGERVKEALKILGGK